MSKRGPRNPTYAAPSGYDTSIVRCAVVIGLVLLGIAWIVVYLHSPWTWMTDLHRWNYLIGFGLIFLGLTTAAHPSTPLGRGQGVVVGMLFCFIFGLLYVLVYYLLGDRVLDVPVMKDLQNYNLVVGIGFMAVGFTFATRWE